MTKKEIVSLSLKLAGIYCLIMSISYLSFASMNVAAALRRESPWHMLTSITSFVSLLLSFTPFVLLLLFATYLIFSRKLPSRMASSIIIQEEEATSFTFQDIQMLAFSIIGVWLLSIAIPRLFATIVRMGDLQPAYYIISQMVTEVLKVALGIYLFLGGKGLVRLWQKSHSARGMKPSN
jgi:hypothetical protein